MVAQSRLLASLLTSSLSPQTCDYSTSHRCIHPLVTSTTTIPFSPLFTSPPKFVYAVDELSSEEKRAVNHLTPNAIPSTWLGPVLKAAFWLEYDPTSLNRDRSQSRHYYTFVLETSASNTIGGDASGCENLIGARCLGNLKNLIAEQTYKAPDGYDGGLGSAILGLYANPPENLGCPADLFGTRWNPPRIDMPILLEPFEPFASYSAGFVREALPSGNASFAHGVPQLKFRSLEEQSARGVVGVTVGWPVVGYEMDAKYPLSEVTVETVCLRVGKSGRGEVAVNPNEGERKDGGRKHRVDLRRR